MSDDRWDEGYGPLMVDGKVGGLGVVVTPRRKVIVSLAGAAVHLDLHATHRLHTKIFDRFKNICAAMCHYDRCQKIGGKPKKNHVHMDGIWYKSTSA